MPGAPLVASAGIAVPINDSPLAAAVIKKSNPAISEFSTSWGFHPIQFSVSEG
jgi:hypothetical protein